MRPEAAVEQHRTIVRLHRAGDLQRAALACKEFVESASGLPLAWVDSCRVALALRNPGKALDYVDRALELLPASARLWVLKAHALRAAGRVLEADDAARRAAESCAADAAASDDLGSYYTATGEFHEALEHFTRAVGLEPQCASFRFNRAAALRIIGRLEEAEAEYDRVIALNPREFEAYLNRAGLRPQTALHNHVPELESALAGSRSHPRNEVFLRYALAKELEDLGEYQRSFAHLAQGSSLRRRHIDYDVARDVATASWIEAAYPRNRLHNSALGYPSDTPIFIVGMPRTGTTLVERILGRHTRVRAAGELTHFADALTSAITSMKGVTSHARRDFIDASTTIDFRALGEDYLARSRPKMSEAARFVDKMPLNYLYCGLIHLSLPNARIIHVTRHPMATCYAIYKTLFKDAYPFSYDLEELGKYYFAYRRLMRHWHTSLPGVILEVSYEALIADLETETRRLLSFCGLEWQAQCLEFHRNESATTTASAAQVRRPLYESSVDLWRRYALELEPLRRVLLAEGLSSDEIAPSERGSRAGGSLSGRMHQ